MKSNAARAVEARVRTAVTVNVNIAKAVEVSKSLSTFAQQCKRDNIARLFFLMVTHQKGLCEQLFYKDMLLRLQDICDKH